MTAVQLLHFAERLKVFGGARVTRLVCDCHVSDDFKDWRTMFLAVRILCPGSNGYKGPFGIVRTCLEGLAMQLQVQHLDQIEVGNLSFQARKLRVQRSTPRVHLREAFLCHRWRDGCTCHAEFGAPARPSGLLATRRGASCFGCPARLGGLFWQMFDGSPMSPP